jgi:hypothetical protein
MMPMIIMSVVNAKVSIERIQKFLLGKELDRFAVVRDDFMDERISITGILMNKREREISR